MHPQSADQHSTARVPPFPIRPETSQNLPTSGVTFELSEPEIDIDEHEHTYRMFVRGVALSALHVLVILAVMAWYFLT